MMKSIKGKDSDKDEFIGGRDLDEKFDMPLEDLQGYEERHACCPNCHTANFESTAMGYIHGPNNIICDINRIHCICGWNGRAYELVPIIKENNLKHRILLCCPITNELLEDYEAMGMPIKTQEELENEAGFILIPHNPKIHEIK